MEILCNLLVWFLSEFRTKMRKSVLFSLSNRNRWETEYPFNIFISYPLSLRTHQPWLWGNQTENGIHLCRNGQTESYSITAGVKEHQQSTGEGVFLLSLLSVILKKGLRWLGKENNRRVIRLFTQSVCLNVKEIFCCSTTFPSIGFTFLNSKYFQD